MNTYNKSYNNEKIFDNFMSYFKIVKTHFSWRQVLGMQPLDTVISVIPHSPPPTPLEFPNPFHSMTSDTHIYVSINRIKKDL